MTTEQTTSTRPRPGGAVAAPASSNGPRRRSLAGIPAAERRLRLAGVSTSILEAGQGPPLVALHGPGADATHWGPVIAQLAATHRVIAPDLPGQGESELEDGEPTVAGVLAWLGELISRTCASPPVLVGYALGGAIAARFAGERPAGIRRLVLVDALGLSPFEPSQSFGEALGAFQTEPSGSTHESLWRQCAFDLDRLRERMGDRWEAFEAYNLDRARTPSVGAALGALMAEFGLSALPARELDRIAVPTALIWGRHDLATPLAVAERVSARHGWPLRVIEDCADDPPVEQPEAFVAALRAALDRREGR